MTETLSTAPCELDYQGDRLELKAGLNPDRSIHWPEVEVSGDKPLLTSEQVTEQFPNVNGLELVAVVELPFPGSMVGFPQDRRRSVLGPLFERSRI